MNNKPKCTLIQKFNGEVVVISPGAKVKDTYKSLAEAEKEIEGKGWMVGISHPTLRREDKENAGHMDRNTSKEIAGSESKGSVYHWDPHHSNLLFGSNVFPASNKGEGKFGKS
jgi:hypothetical protein